MCLICSMLEGGRKSTKNGREAIAENWSAQLDKKYSIQRK